MIVQSSNPHDFLHQSIVSFKDPLKDTGNKGNN